jgi:hypothetical protein
MLAFLKAYTLFVIWMLINTLWFLWNLQ